MSAYNRISGASCAHGPSICILGSRAILPVPANFSPIASLSKCCPESACFKMGSKFLENKPTAPYRHIFQEDKKMGFGFALFAYCGTIGCGETGFRVRPGMTILRDYGQVGNLPRTIWGWHPRTLARQRPGLGQESAARPCETFAKRRVSLFRRGRKI